MDKGPRIAIAVLLSLVVLASGGFYLFERFERSEIAGAAGEPCGDRTTSTADALPFDLPLTDGATVLRVDTQGATTVAFASIPGGRNDIVDQRDQVLRDLEGAGYEVTGTDQEPTFEAEAQLTGANAGTLRVKPLCEGLLEVRYKIEK